MKSRIRKKSKENLDTVGTHTDHEDWDLADSNQNAEDDEDFDDEYEDEIYEARQTSNKSNGGSSWLGCRTIAGLILLGLLVFVAWVVFAKPLAPTNIVKRFLNASYGSEEVVYDRNQARIDWELDMVELSETQLFYLLFSEQENNFVQRIELEQDTIVLMRDISNQGLPLWLAIEVSKMEVNTGQVVVDEVGDYEFVVSRVGFGRFQIPEDLVTNFFNNILNTVSIDQSGSPKSRVFDLVFGENASLVLNANSVEIAPDVLTVEVTENEYFKNLKDSIIEQGGGLIDGNFGDFGNFDINNLRDLRDLVDEFQLELGDLIEPSPTLTPENEI